MIRNPVMLLAVRPTLCKGTANRSAKGRPIQREVIGKVLITECLYDFRTVSSVTLLAFNFFKP